MNSNMSQLLAVIVEMDKEDLFFLNHQIIDRLRMLQKSRQHDSMKKFIVGDIVSFSNSDGSLITGTIMRLNQKTVTLVTDDRQQWKVSPSLLSKVVIPSTAPVMDGLTSDLNTIGRNESGNGGNGKGYKGGNGKDN